MSFHEWGQQYGTLYQVNLAGSNHIWIGDEKIAHELLSRKAAIYSDRPNIPALLCDNRTSGQYLPLMSNDRRMHLTSLIALYTDQAFRRMAPPATLRQGSHVRLSKPLLLWLP